MAFLPHPKVMQWSKIRTRIKDFFTPEIAARVDFHLTRYRVHHDQPSRAWVTIDGEQILDASFFVWLREYPGAVTEAQALYPDEEPAHLCIQIGYEWHTRTERATELLAQRAVHEPSHLYTVLREYPSLAVADALASPNPLVRALAMLDKRVGQRTLAKIKPAPEDHPLIRKFYELRTGSKTIAF